MILVDTSVWIDHLRRGDDGLTELLNQRLVLTHPFVIGELALGNLRQRDIVLSALLGIPRANVANDDEVMRLINQESLFGFGIGYIDAHLLAAARLAADATLWTRDKRLSAVADRLSLAARVAQ